jgi:hypothetical protein
MPPDPDGPRPVASTDNTDRTAMRLVETACHPDADGLLRTSWLLSDSRMTEEGAQMGHDTDLLAGSSRTGPALTLPGSGCQALPVLTVLVVALGTNGVIAGG